METFSLGVASGRGESYSVQNRTGPRTGSDRTGPHRSGPRSRRFSYSVFSPVPVWTGPDLDRTGGLNNIGGTVVPRSTARPCQSSVVFVFVSSFPWALSLIFNSLNV